MTLSEKRSKYIRRQMELASTWIDVIEREIYRTPASSDEYERLTRLYWTEVRLYTALRHALVANQDTLALL